MIAYYHNGQSGCNQTQHLQVAIEGVEPSTAGLEVPRPESAGTAKTTKHFKVMHGPRTAECFVSFQRGILIISAKANFVKRGQFELNKFDVRNLASLRGCNH